MALPGPAVQVKSRPRFVYVLGALLLIAVAVALAAARKGEKQEQADRQALGELDRRLGPERVAFRKEKDEEMRGPQSPLSRVDYIHLDPGDSRLGAGPEAQVRLPAEALVPYQGDVRLFAEGGRLLLRARPALKVKGPRGEPMGQAADVVEVELVNRATISIGRLLLMVAGLPQQPALAVYDPEAPARRDYRGLHYYPDDSRYAAVAQLDRYPAPRPIRVEASRGEPQEMQTVGMLRFQVNGTPCSMEAFSAGAPGELFLIFKDHTNSQPGGSYGGGRFLYARVGPGDRVLLDFNQAWNPLCAYSHYFHCPLPPRSNWLPVALPVGEQTYAAHSGADAR